MDKKILSKILAVMLVITLTFANFIFLAVYAAEISYEEQETNINKTGISFDAYFVSDTGGKTHTMVTEMNNSELKLFLNVSVTKGYLKDAIISMENANFKVISSEELPEGVEAIDTENNTVTLKQINKGENKEIALPIEVIKDEQFDLNNFSKEAKVNLTGAFVNDVAKEIKAEKTILVNLALSENVEAYLEGVVSKHVVFEEEGKQKELLQLTVSSKVVDNLLPIKATEIKIVVPKLYETDPEYVSVVSTSTKATNGNDGTGFGIENYTCENGIISINVSNLADENNKVTWLKNATDEYIINLVYAIDENVEAGVGAGERVDARPTPTESAQSEENQDEGEKLEEKHILTMASRLTLYNSEEKVIETGVNQELEMLEVSDNLVSFEINNENNEIAKGYMLVKDAANTEYTQNIEVNIGYSPIVNNIEIDKGSEYYSDETEKQYTATTYYKKVEINRDNLVKLLGEDGTIDIISEKERVGTLNAENTEYVFENEFTEVKMITSEPKAEGKLVIKSEKYIKSAEYDTEITSTLNKMTTTIVGKSNFSEEESLTEATLVEPTLQVTSSISNSKLSTVVENENVELRIALKTNNNTNRLFKNPIIEIELPSYIKEVEVKNVNLLYNTELIPTQGTISANNAGNKVITVKLEGEQTKFNDVLSVDGMTLIIGTDLIVDKTTPSITQEMIVRVTNNETEIVETNSSIEYIAPSGMITLNTISGYNNNEITTSMSGNAEVGKLLVASSKKIATQTMTIINNYDYTCGDVQILGRTTTEGNKDVSSKQDLGSTFTAKMVNEIKVVEGVEEQEVTIYYSENDSATEDINDVTNAWTTNREEIEEVKSYLIVLSKTMAKGDKIAFSYDIEIPEGLRREQSTYSMYKVNYTNMDGALQGVVETAKATVVGLSTGGGTELELELSANVENGTGVKEGDIIEYTIHVKNVGKITANNIEVSVDIPKYSYYTEKQMDVDNEIYVRDAQKQQFTSTIDSIEPGKTQEVKFLLEVGARVEYKIENFVKRENYETEEEYQAALTNEELLTLIKETESLDVKVQAKAKIVEDEEEIVFTSNEFINEKIRAYFNLYWKAEDTRIEPGKQKTYNIYVEPMGIEDIHNVQITCKIPKGLKLIDTVYYDDSIKQEIDGTTITWTIAKLSYDTIIQLTVEIEEVKEETTISVEMVGTCDEFDGEIKTEVDTFTIGIPKLEVEHSSMNTLGYLTEGDEIGYILTVKNIGNVNAYDVVLTDYASEGLALKSIKYNSQGKTFTYGASGQKANVTVNLPAHEALIVELTAEATKLREGEETRIVSNRFEIVANGIEKISSSTITHVVNKKIYSAENESGNVTRHSISGLVWVDANSNGIRELDEELLSDIPVILLNQKGKALSSSITNVNGTYIFSNVAKGNYIIAFLYDMANYDVTLYNIGDISINNDAVTMELNIEGVSTKCAATNLITLAAGNITNIDLGLTVSPKFDLSLEKTISKITVQTSKGINTSNYNSSTLQKIEIPSKEMEKATVAIEYLITVRNEGAIAGYAKRIVDYLSATDLKFNSETNADWYLGTDGNLYNSTLANTLLQPGESRTLKLVLTKKVSEKNTGLTNNTAEIYEASNDEGVEDFNSKPANKASNENDLGQADIIIGPKTGVIVYIGIALIFMIIVTAGIYILNRKVRKI